MLLQAVEKAPFFTNDWPGLIKLVISLSGFAGAIILAVWRFMRGDLKQDINGLGTRLASDEARGTAHNTRLEALERQRERDDEKFRNLDIGVARVEQATKSLQEQTTDGKLEIIAKINDMQVRVENRINESNVGMAEMRGEMKAFSQMFANRTRNERGGGQDDRS